jgi:hypothetical protein
MKQCFYCHGEIDEGALKCQHCGEWMAPPPADENRGHNAVGSTVTEGLKWYGAFKLGQSAIGGAIVLLILCVIVLPVAAFFLFPLLMPVILAGVVLLHTLMPVILVGVVIALAFLFIRSLRSRY